MLSPRMPLPVDVDRRGGEHVVAGFDEAVADDVARVAPIWSKHGVEIRSDALGAPLHRGGAVPVLSAFF